MYEDPGAENGQDSGPDRRKQTGWTSIHCAAALETIEAATELEKINISTFQDTVAEIALAVARRRQKPNP